MLIFNFKQDANLLLKLASSKKYHNYFFYCILFKKHNLICVNILV